jgi:hypothetical protein
MRGSTAQMCRTARQAALRRCFLVRATAYRRARVICDEIARSHRAWHLMIMCRVITSMSPQADRSLLRIRHCGSRREGGRSPGRDALQRPSLRRTCRADQVLVPLGSRPLRLPAAAIQLPAHSSVPPNARSRAQHLAMEADPTNNSAQRTSVPASQSGPKRCLGSSHRQRASPTAQINRAFVARPITRNSGS